MKKNGASTLSTLYLYANGVGGRMIAIDTVLRGIFGFREGDAPPALLARFRRLNGAFAELRDVYKSLSYMADWREAFETSPRLAVEACNINNLVHYGQCLLRLPRYDLVVVAHSAAGDDMHVLSRSAAAFSRRRGKLVMFIGNEYDLLDEKIGFMKQTGAEFVCSQLPLEAARYLYGECPGITVLEMPHALNPKAYQPIAGTARDIDIGFIGDIYWPFIGDRERTDLIEWFEKNAGRAGLRADIRRARISRDEWNRFLNGCKAIIGAESGTYYLNDRGRLLEKARTYNLFENRNATFEEVFDRFYRGVQRGVSGKSISSRHFEPVGTKTCQILLEGHYNGILRPDEHYIAVKRDLSNIDEAIERYRDATFRERMVEQAYEYVLAHHTYAHRVQRLVASVA